MFCRPSTGSIGNLPRSIDEYAGVNNLTSCPAACRYFVSAEDTSARPPVFDRGAASEAKTQTVRVIVWFPVYDVFRGIAGWPSRGGSAGFVNAPLSDRTGRAVAAHRVDRGRRCCCE